MKFKPEAKVIINKEITVHNGNCIEMKFARVAGKRELFYESAFVAKENIKNIDGVNVLIDDDTLEMLKDVVFYSKSGELAVRKCDNNLFCKGKNH